MLNIMTGVPQFMVAIKKLDFCENLIICFRLLLVYSFTVVKLTFGDFESTRDRLNLWGSAISLFQTNCQSQPIRKILITTLGRSGSSLTLDAFSKLSYNPYSVFEPLYDIKKDIYDYKQKLVY